MAKDKQKNRRNLQELVGAIEKELMPDSPIVQNSIQKHYEYMKIVGSQQKNVMQGALILSWKQI